MTEAKYRDRLRSQMLELGDRLVQSEGLAGLQARRIEGPLDAPLILHKPFDFLSRALCHGSIPFSKKSTICSVEASASS